MLTGRKLTTRKKLAVCNAAHKGDCYFISDLEITFLLADPLVSSSVMDGGSLELGSLPKSHKSCAAELQLAWPHRATDLQFLFPRTQKVVGTLCRGSSAAQKLFFNRMVKPRFTWAFTSAPPQGQNRFSALVIQFRCWAHHYTSLSSVTDLLWVFG